jgi:tRNA U34 5-carboxymethylaminomethyl modifying GTPase MnmE/TrmE
VGLFSVTVQQYLLISIETNKLPTKQSDIRQALHYLGEITGEITTDDLLANIFGKFCIGK